MKYTFPELGSRCPVSLPARECGLKSVEDLHIDESYQVTPYVKVWIDKSIPAACLEQRRLLKKILT